MINFSQGQLRFDETWGLTCVGLVVAFVWILLTLLAMLRKRRLIEEDMDLLARDLELLQSEVKMLQPSTGSNSEDPEEH